MQKGKSGETSDKAYCAIKCPKAKYYATLLICVQPENENNGKSANGRKRKAPNTGVWQAQVTLRYRRAKQTRFVITGRQRFIEGR